jgi:hypothetical protein
MFSQKCPVWCTVHTDGNFAYLFKPEGKANNFLFLRIFLQAIFAKNTCWEKIREMQRTMMFAHYSATVFSQ